ncbi:hypothetical protein B0T14DRAFT_282213 [Immersiella caudata]|uniref:Uncharacterized protein n=1 Tax=Immersiella caudata TaxID=314043 RepID=A0AA40BU13_9PEZI|nr:hypothetical protein B0T14DRAFT_282213 [Immersiella caudata]
MLAATAGPESAFAGCTASPLGAQQSRRRGLGTARVYRCAFSMENTGTGDDPNTTWPSDIAVFCNGKTCELLRLQVVRFFHHHHHSRKQGILLSAHHQPALHRELSTLQLHGVGSLSTEKGHVVHPRRGTNRAGSMSACSRRGRGARTNCFEIPNAHHGPELTWHPCRVDGMRWRGLSGCTTATPARGLTLPMTSGRHPRWLPCSIHHPSPAPQPPAAPPLQELQRCATIADGHAPQRWERLFREGSAHLAN